MKGMEKYYFTFTEEWKGKAGRELLFFVLHQEAAKLSAF